MNRVKPTGKLEIFCQSTKLLPVALNHLPTKTSNFSAEKNSLPASYSVALSSLHGELVSTSFLVQACKNFRKSLAEILDESSYDHAGLSKTFSLMILKSSKIFRQNP